MQGSIPIEQLYAVLQSTFSPDGQTRKAAEQALKQLNQTNGDTVSLLRVAIEDTAELPVRQQASIVLKNIIRRRWEVGPEPPSGIVALSEEDKAAVRENLMEGVVRAPEKVGNQLIECIRSVIYSDFPEQWPTLMPQIAANLASGDSKRGIGALAVMRIIARRYEYTDEDERKPLYEIVNATWPDLLRLFQLLLSHNDASTDLATMLKLLLKTFWSSTYLEIPPKLLEPEMFHGWLEGILTLVVRPVPSLGQPEDPEDRARWPWWKVKKWALHIADRFFSRYGSSRMCKDRREDQAFHALFREHMALRYLEGALGCVAAVTRGEWMSSRTINLSVRILTHSVGLDYLYPTFSPHIQNVIQHAVFPLLCFTEADQELWEDDPLEYIRKGYDLKEDLYSVRTASTTFLTDLCEDKRARKDHMDQLMQFVVGVFGRFQAAGGAAGATADMARQMDGALLAVGSLAEELKKRKRYKASLEPMLVHHVIPCFSSPHGHLRAKACWVAGEFADIKFASGTAEPPAKGKGPTFAALLEHVVSRLRDPALPVRVDATVALRSLVDTLADPNVLKPALQGILDSFFQLINEVENEDLVFTLEVIVERLGDEVGPYAIAMCQSLVAALGQIIGKEGNVDLDDPLADDDDGDDDDVSALAAYGCLRALSTVLDSVSSMRQLYPHLEQVLFPMLVRVITMEDMLDEALDLVTYLTYFGPGISDAMWSLWPKILAALKDWGASSFDSALPALDNFITRGRDRFLADPQHAQGLFEICRYALTGGEVSDMDAKPAVKLMQCVLENCPGMVDVWVGPYVQLAVAKLAELASEEDPLDSLKDLCVCLIADALHYNAPLTLGVLQQSGHLLPLLQKWFAMIFANKKEPKQTAGQIPAAAAPKHFKTLGRRKMAALGLLALLRLPDAALPAEINQGMPQIGAGLVRLLSWLKDLYEKQEQEDAEDDEDDEEESEEEEEEEEEDDGSGLRHLDSYGLEKLAKKGQLSANALGGDEEGEEGDEWADDWTDDEDYESPIDNVDPFVLFRDTLAAFQQANPGRLAAISAALGPQGQASVQEAVAYATKRELSMAAAAQEKAERLAKQGA